MFKKLIWVLSAIWLCVEILCIAPSALLAEGGPKAATSEKSDRLTVPTPRLSPLPATNRQLSLNGSWRFNPALPDNPAVLSAGTATNWKPIRVPGEWVTQGFNVPTNQFAAYFREFRVPKDWLGSRIKLRFDTVHSLAKVWVNGREAGKHEGGFVPFELDVTDAVQPGTNSIVVAVQNESTSDVLASATQYATHPLGGITRKVTLFAVPRINIAALALTTRFEPGYRNANLQYHLELANESAAGANAVVRFTLLAPDGRSIDIPSHSGGLHLAPDQLKPQTTYAADGAISVADVRQWDPEHPHLYTLQTELESGSSREVALQRFGFRQVEVRGNQVFLNGYPIKLRGVCRHEVHPLLGRSLEPELWRQDAELLRAGNCNFIRTSHYPPAEEFLEACDQLGLLVECEAPLCWVQHNANRTWRRWNYLDPKYLPYLLEANLANVAFNRNHPSIIIWSLANESYWSPLFAEVLKRVKELDPSRPVSFHDQCWGNSNNGGSQADIAVYHYPGQNGPAACTKEARPVDFGEYCHLNAYNRREQIADPGLRDIWGLGLAGMWESMRTNQGCLGGSIWAAIDDTFFLPDGGTVGYGTWGPLDGWRRTKPEFWHMAKSYSPVRIVETNLALPAAGGALRLTVENRSDCANLSEFSFDWTIAGESGVARTAAEPGQRGILEIPASRNLAGRELELRVTGPRGFLVDAYRFSLGGESTPTPPPSHELGSLELVQDAHTISVNGNAFCYVFATGSGQLLQARAGRSELGLAGPCLTLVPLDGEGGGTQMTGREPAFQPLWGLCTDWKASVVKAEKTGTVVTLRSQGAYAEAKGGYEMTIDGTGRLKVAWTFTLNKALNPRQTGVTFVLPRTCQTLSWRRRGQWSWYPEDHIGRAVGTTKAFPAHASCGLAGPRTQPTWPWSEDYNEYGCNDFRSTKLNIFFAQLVDDQGLGLRALAAADRHAHAWMDGSHACLLVADYANDGAEKFLQATRAIANRPIAMGGTVAGSAQVEVVSQAANRLHE
jgi:beta-galactosidase